MHAAKGESRPFHPGRVRATDRREAVGHPLDPWVPGVRAGENAAFRAVYEATADDLASFAYGMLRDRGAAEDMVQQAFLELVNASAKFRGNGEALRVWLFRSVRYRCLDELKRAGRRRERPMDELPDSSTAGRTDEMAAMDPELERALRSLTERQRSMVVLRHVVGLSGEEVARVVGVSRGAAYAALGRAEKKLKSLLEREAHGN